MPSRKRQRGRPESQAIIPARLAKNALTKPARQRRLERENRLDEDDEDPLPVGRRRRLGSPLTNSDQNRGQRARSESTDEVDYFSPDKSKKCSSSTVVPSDDEPSSEEPQPEEEEDKDKDKDEDKDKDKDSDNEGRIRFRKCAKNILQVADGVFAAPRPGAAMYANGVRTFPPPLGDVVEAMVEKPPIAKDGAAPSQESLSK